MNRRGHGWPVISKHAGQQFDPDKIGPAASHGGGTLKRGYDASLRHRLCVTTSGLAGDTFAVKPDVRGFDSLAAQFEAAIMGE